jgi:ribonucleoside-diphosphate reductase alpha chain
MRAAVPELLSPRRTSPAIGPAPRTTGHTRSFQIGDLTGTLTSSAADTGGPAGFDLRVGTHGSTLAGLTDALATATSLALQQGAPLPAVAEQWQQTWFVPNGPTDDPEIPHTTSLADYLARRLTLDHLTAASTTATAPSRSERIDRR